MPARRLALSPAAAWPPRAWLPALSPTNVFSPCAAHSIAASSGVPRRYGSNAHATSIGTAVAGDDHGIQRGNADPDARRSPAR